METSKANAFNVKVCNLRLQTFMSVERLELSTNSLKARKTAFTQSN